MKCHYCGHEMPETHDFCENCGAKLDKATIKTETASAIESSASPNQTPPVSNQAPPTSYQVPPASYQAPQMYQAPPSSYQNQPMYQTPPPAYQTSSPYGEELAPVVSMGHWMLVFLLMCIPFANIVLVFVWSFSKDTNPSKRNFMRAALIWTLIVIAIYIIIFIVAGVSFFDQLYY